MTTVWQEKPKLSYKSSRVIPNDLDLQIWAFLVAAAMAYTNGSNPILQLLPPDSVEPFASAYAQLAGFLRQVE